MMKFQSFAVFISFLFVLSQVATADVPTLRELAANAIAEKLLQRYSKWDEIDLALRRMNLPADLQTFIKQELYSHLRPKRILASASKLGAMISREGKCYVWGKNSRSWESLPLENKEGESSLVLGAWKNTPFQAVATTRSYVLMLDRNGRINEGDRTQDPKRKIVDIQGGDGVFLTLDHEGKVHGWLRDHSSAFGELGNGTSSSQAHPMEIQGALKGKKVISIAAGDVHGLALDENGKVYGWGWNHAGQARPGFRSQYVLSPEEIGGPWGESRIVSIHSGKQSFCSFAIDEKGNLYSWGAGLCSPWGQIRKIEGPWGKEIVYRAGSDSHSIFVLTLSGKLYLQMGLSPFELISGPWGGKKLVAFELAQDKIFVMDEGQSVYSWETSHVLKAYLERAQKAVRVFSLSDH